MFGLGLTLTLSLLFLFSFFIRVNPNPGERMLAPSGQPLTRTLPVQGFGLTRGVRAAGNPPQM